MRVSLTSDSSTITSVTALTRFDLAVSQPKLAIATSHAVETKQSSVEAATGLIYTSTARLLLLLRQRQVLHPTCLKVATLRPPILALLPDLPISTMP